MALIEAEAVDFSYPGGPVALQQVSFAIDPGEKIAILGANGSGKSTLLKILNGLLFPSSGAIRYRNKALTEAALKDPEFFREFRSRVGFVFQNPDFQLFSPTVFEEVAFGPLQLGLGETEVRQRVADTLRLLRLEALAERPPYQLSGGEKKRVAIASVLSMNPSVLLLDEPTLALDPRSRWELVDWLVELHAAGKTLVIATHDLEVAQVLSDRAIVLGEHQRLLRVGRTPEVLGDQALMEQANLIHVHRHRHADGWHRHPHSHLSGQSPHHEDGEGLKNR
jgi:cobalt/nickel transport system ATP-binding protein